MADEAPPTLRNSAAQPERDSQPESGIDAALGGAFNTSGRSNLPPQTRLRFLNVDEAAADEAAAAPPPVAAAPGMFFASRDDDATRRGDGNEATADQLEGLSIEELRDIATACGIVLTDCVEKDDIVRRVLQDIVKCFGGLYGDCSPLTLEELQNYEWPIKDIVMKFRTAGMRDGVRRTLEEAQKIYEEIPEDVRRTPEAISDYLWGSKRKDWSHIVAHSNGGSDSADGGFWEDRSPNRSRGNATVSDDELSKALHVDCLASEKAKIRTAGKAAAIAAGLAALVTAAPKLIREVQSNKSAEEIKKEVKRLLGEAVWEAMCQAGVAGLHAYLRLSLGPFAGSIVGTFAVESIVATWAYVHGDASSARRCIERITSSVGIACVTAAFPEGTMGQMIRACIIFTSVNLSETVRERIPIIVDNVSKYVTGKLGLACTVTGTALVLCSQTGNAVYIIGLLGAEASTGTAIASLSGAAANSAALAWLGGGPLANGGGGMALGQYILTTATYTGYGLALVGSGVLAWQVWEYAKRPQNVSFCAEVVLGPDDEPEFTGTFRVHLSAHGGNAIGRTAARSSSASSTTDTFAPGASVIYKDGTSGEVQKAHEERAASATPPSTPPPRFIYIMVGVIMGCLMTIIVLALTMGLQEAAVSAVGLLEKVTVPFQNASRPVLGFYTSEEFHIPAPLVCPPGSQLHGLEPTF